MNQRFLKYSFFVLCFAWLLPVSVHADPDVRNIRPVVMLLVDTSGSMEWKPDCVCTTADCVECLPVCGTGTGDDDRNRWAMILEGLTGEWDSYSCTTEDRDTLPKYFGLYDEDYFIPHHALPNEEAVPVAQDSNGVLDVFVERAKFGLMTFDSYSTFIEFDQNDPMLRTDYELAANIARNPTMDAMWSYGDRKPFSIFGGTDVYMLDNGVRNETATEGQLVSVGTGATYAAVNASIQQALLGTGGGTGSVRPFGGTPIAAMLTDLEYYLQNNTDVTEKVVIAGDGDEFYSCRPRIGLLITDGVPNSDMRGGITRCEDLGNPVGETGCPFDIPEDLVSDMMSSEELTLFYPVGFSLNESEPGAAAAVDFMNDLASVGETGDADFISTSDELIGVLNEVMGAVQSGASSRTAPLVGVANIFGLQQAEYLSGFRSPEIAGDPWDGVLERRSYSCTDGAAVAQEITNDDRFQVKLNEQSTAPGNITIQSGGSTLDLPTGSRDRNLWTVLPETAAELENRLAGAGQDEVTDQDGVTGLTFLAPESGTYTRNLAPIELTNDTIDPSFFDVADTTARDELVDFMYGESGTAREDHRLSSIYHSNPVLVGPLTNDTEDATYNAFRRGVSVRPNGEFWSLTTRPRIVYAASNDGIVHAFVGDDQPSAVADEFECVEGLEAGAELWGFIPPMLINNLKDLQSGFQWMTDGSLEVKEVYDVRSRFNVEIDDTVPASDTSDIGTGFWRTVLVFGLRAGGKGALALDITNPCQPEFLWQFTDSDLGFTYGQPSLAQVTVSAEGHERGVVVLPGGLGTLDVPSSPCTPAGDSVTTDVTDITPRATRRCWLTEGRALYFLDVPTGEILKKFDSSHFMSPLNGAVSVFNGNVGEGAYTAYFSDADGVMWRSEFSLPDTDTWTVKAFHDMFHDVGGDGQPAYNPPLITTNPQGRLVILHATGDIDILDSTTTVNKVVSITEVLDFDTDGSAEVSGDLNWEKTLENGETNMGPLELFNGRVFFSTFVPTSDPVNACVIGGGRIWGLSYLEDPASPGNPEPRIKQGDGTFVEFLDKVDVPELEDTIVTGVQLTTNSVCQSTRTVTLTDYLTGETQTTTVPVPQAPPTFSLVSSLSGATLGSGGASVLSISQDPSQLQVESTVIDIADLFE